ncbi:unnamed protein product, partial [Ascophyllum nodosum]
VGASPASRRTGLELLWGWGNRIDLSSGSWGELRSGISMGVAGATTLRKPPVG